MIYVSQPKVKTFKTSVRLHQFLFCATLKMRHYLLQSLTLWKLRLQMMTMMMERPMNRLVLVTLLSMTSLLISLFRHARQPATPEEEDEYEALREIIFFLALSGVTFF